jgi:hypothetical protein
VGPGPSHASPPHLKLMDVFTSNEMWNKHPDPAGAGQVTSIGGNMDVFAWQPVLPHMAVASSLLTTKVVATGDRLPITVSVSAAGVANSDRATGANTAIFQSESGIFITASITS